MQREFTSRSTPPSPFARPGIEFDLPFRASITLRLLNAEGEELVTLIENRSYDVGTHTIDLGEFGKNVAFYQLSINRDGVVHTDTKKILMSL